MAEVTDRSDINKGALPALTRCKPALHRVQSRLCDSGYAGQPFARGVRETLDEHITVQCAVQVFSGTEIGCMTADCCSKALGGRLPSVECRRTLL
jgi:hypothetical protein